MRSVLEAIHDATGLVEKRLQSFKFVEFEQRLSAIEAAIAAKAQSRGGRP